MNIQLKNGVCIFLLEEEFGMSNMFASLYQETTIESLLSDYLKADYDKIANGVTQAASKFPLSSLVNTPNTQAFFLTFIRSCTGPDAEPVIARISQNFTSIFNVNYTFTFIPDAVLVELATFMRIKHSKKGLKMFDHLADLYRQSPAKDLNVLVDEETRVFLQFFQNKTRHQQEQLLAAACQIDLQPLIAIAALCLASALLHMTDSEVRQQYNVPEKFTHAITDKLITTVSIEDTWAKFNEKK